MATERQIAANRRNAGRSTGPKSAEGKARSRANATRHGLAAELAPVEAEALGDFEDRRAKWGDEFRPVGEAAGWALDRAVAASLRVERCERASDEVTLAHRVRAKLAWDQDREVEAAVVFGRLGRDPVLASRQLRATLAGAWLMVEAWVGLVARLATGEDWSESEASKALDLLGVAADLRSGRTKIDPGSGVDPVMFRRGLALVEVERLEALIETSLEPLDAIEHRLAAEGDSALLSRPSKLVLRYERDAWRRYRESIRVVRDSAASADVAPPAPAPAPLAVSRPIARPAVAVRPEVRERALADVSPSFEEPHRALLDQVRPIPLAVTNPLAAMGFDESGWIEELERRIEAGPGGLAAAGPIREGSLPFTVGVAPKPGQRPASERTQWMGVMAGSRG